MRSQLDKLISIDPPSPRSGSHWSFKIEHRGLSESLLTRFGSKRADIKRLIERRLGFLSLSEMRMPARLLSPLAEALRYFVLGHGEQFVQAHDALSLCAFNPTIRKRVSGTSERFNPVATTPLPNSVSTTVLALNL